MDCLNIHGSVYTEILQGIKSESPESIPQCYYVVGRRGYGKTVLLRNIEKSLKEAVGYGVLYVDCLMSPSFSIMEAIEENHLQGSRLVLLLDDMDVLLGNMGRADQFRLRSLLYQRGAPVIVGAGEELSSDFTDYQAPFYDAFVLYHLGKLSQELSMELIGKMRSECRHRKIDASSETVSTLLDEIGRTPESCRLLANVPSFGVKRERILSEALEPLSLYYRERIMSLSPSQRKTLVYMLSRGEPVLLKEIREATAQTASDISPQLKALALKGLISTTKQGVKKTEYSVADKVMVSWYRNCVAKEDVKIL